MILSELAPLVSAQHGVFYTLASLEDGGEPVLMYQAGYAYKERKHLANHFRLGEGLVGQCAQEKQRILLSEVPSDYVTINSGLGESTPLNIIVLPILFEGSVRAVLELASFSRFSPTHQAFLDQLTESIGLVLNTIEANTLTENLLKQSQSQAQELQSRQEELRELQRGPRAPGAAAWPSRTARSSARTRRSSAAKRLVEEKAEQLAISSKYKSEFFSNMSHELRTPLNSLLILAGELADNHDANLTDTQVQYASVIHSSGTDLLRLLDDILDLAKVESGTVTLEISELSSGRAAGRRCERDFQPRRRPEGPRASRWSSAPELPATIATDAGRLRQVLKNLLSNAFKFTEHGEVSVHVGWPRAAGARRRDARARGVGRRVHRHRHRHRHRADLQARMFEAFAQADGTTAREYGGTGLGLSISRELVRLLGGEIALTQRRSGEGSTFTVYLPRRAGPYGGRPPRRLCRRAPHPRHRRAAAAPAATATPPTALAVRRARDRAASCARAEPDLTAGPATEKVAGRRRRHPQRLRAHLAARALRRSRSARRRVVQEALEILEATPDIDIVLMDIMMPVMDGYATMRAMRKLTAVR